MTQATSDYPTMARSLPAALLGATGLWPTHKREEAENLFSVLWQEVSVEEKSRRLGSVIEHRTTKTGNAFETFRVSDEPQPDAPPRNSGKGNCHTSTHRPSPANKRWQWKTIVSTATNGTRCTWQWANRNIFPFGGFASV